MLQQNSNKTCKVDCNFPIEATRWRDLNFTSPSFVNVYSFLYSGSITYVFAAVLDVQLLGADEVEQAAILLLLDAAERVDRAGL